eukprot:gene4436-3235_t
MLDYNDPEKAVQLLVELSDSYSSVTSTNDINVNNVNLFGWSCSKSMGHVPQDIPCTGDRVTLENSSVCAVRILRSTKSGKSFFCDGKNLGDAFLFHVSIMPRSHMHLVPCSGSYTYLTQLETKSRGKTKNYRDAFSLLQRKIIEWCFSYFFGHSETREISGLLLSKNFPSLLALEYTQREYIIEEAVKNYSSGQLLYFNESIVSRIRGRHWILPPPRRCSDLRIEDSFERSLSTCWVSLRQSVSGLLQSLKIIADRIEAGYHVKSLVMLQCLSIVRSVLDFAIHSVEKYCQLYESSSRKNDLRDISMLVCQAALEIRSNFSTPHTINRSLDVYSLFSQAPDPETPVLACSIPSLCINIQSFEVDEMESNCLTAVTSERSDFTALALGWLTNINTGAFGEVFEFTDKDELQFIIPSSDAMGTEFDALQAVYAAARKRRRRDP